MSAQFCVYTPNARQRELGSLSLPPRVSRCLDALPIISITPTRSNNVLCCIKKKRRVLPRLAGLRETRQWRTVDTLRGRLRCGRGDAHLEASGRQVRLSFQE